MEKDECWETFLTSGSVVDYLRFKQKEQDEMTHVSQGSDLQMRKKETDGSCDRVEHNAGFY